MANDCLVTKLKGEVNNPNLPILGMAKMIVDTTDASANIRIPFLGNKTGAKIISGGTFVDGTTEIINNADMVVAPNKVLEILFPKYNCIPVPNERIIVSSVNYGVIAYNADELEYNQVSETAVNNIKLETTRTGYSMKGNLETLISKLTGMTTITSNGVATSELTGNIISIINKYANTLITVKVPENNGFTGSAEQLHALPLVQSLIIRNTIGVTGSVEHMLDGAVSILTFDITNSAGLSGDRDTMVCNMMQSDKTAFKARTDSMIIVSHESNVTSSILNFVAALKLQFTGTSTVNLLRNSDQVKIGEYDIDTNVMTKL